MSAHEMVGCESIKGVAIRVMEVAVAPGWYMDTVVLLVEDVEKGG